MAIIFLKKNLNLKYKKVGKWVSLGCIVGYNWVTVMDCINFGFNDIIFLYKKTIQSKVGQSFYVITKHLCNIMWIK